MPPSENKTYYVYIITNVRNTVLYVGITNNLERRMFEHKNPTHPSFTERYRVNKLVYYEEYPEVMDAICREKQIKGWSRVKKLKLIDRHNPPWEELFCGLPRDSSR